MTFMEVVSDLHAGTNKYIFYVDQPTKLGLFFFIREGYEAYKYLLYSSVSTKVIKEN